MPLAQAFRFRAITTLLLFAAALGGCASEPVKPKGPVLKDVTSSLPATLRKAGWKGIERSVIASDPAAYRWRRIVTYRNSLGMDFALAPPGEFKMGDTVSPRVADRRWPGASPAFYQDAQPRHGVKLTRPVLIGAYEVKRAEFARFVKETGYKTDAERKGEARAFRVSHWAMTKGVTWKKPLFAQTSDHPVVCVSWLDAKAFCAWLTKRDKLTYRLPTEAEWEYAARAGSQTTWYWGEDETGAQGRANIAGEGEQVAWEYIFDGVRDGYTWTAPVGRFMPNALGLYDVIGNACEWCEDRYGAGYYSASPKDNPPGPAKGKRRVLRGGAWSSYPAIARSAYRDALWPDGACVNNGFRVVCEWPGPLPSEKPVKTQP